MPQLPDLSQGQMQIPQMGGGSFGAPTIKSPASIIGQSLSEVGQMAMEYQKHENTLAAENGWTKLREGVIDLAAGQDGFLNKRGEQALDGKIHEQYLGRFDKMVGDVASGLSNDKQRELFKQRADVSRIQVSENLMQHVMKQDEVVTKDRYEGTLATEQKTAVMNSYNPPAIALSVLRVENAVDGIAQKYDKPKEWVDAQKMAATSKIHEAVIENMIMDGHDLDAKTYYSQVKNDLSPDVNERIAPKLKSATTDGKAFRAVDEIWQSKGPKNINDPVKTFDMETAIRAKFKDDPLAQKSAIAEIRSRAQGFNVQQQEITNSNISAVLKNFDAGMQPMNIRKTKEFQDLSGKDQDTLINHMNTTTKNKMNTLTPDSARMVDAVKGMALTDPVAFSNLDVGTLLEKMPSDQVQEIINLKMKVAITADKAARVNSFLSDRSIRAVLDSAEVTKPGKKPDSEDYNAFVQRFSDGIEQFQQENKRIPKPEEARKIAAQLTATIPIYQEHFWNTKKAKAYQLNEEKLATPMNWEQIKALPKGTPFIHFQDNKPYTKK